jgi:histidinol-phosphate aminotransferase
VIICPPTYGMYEVAANINNVSVKKVFLTKETFQLDTENILNAVDQNTKLIFVCCPNNPTGNGVKWKDIQFILENFKGIVIVDEAYIEFASYNSLVSKLENYPNLVILQTFSKAWGLAGLRLGMAFASEAIISVFNKIKPPYNINSSSQKLVLEALRTPEIIQEQIKKILTERAALRTELERLPFILKVFPSEANFLLVKVDDPNALYEYLVAQQIIVRNRTKIELCEGCLRITIGTANENQTLLNALKRYK